MKEQPTIEVNNLTYNYQDGSVGLKNVFLQVQSGSRVLCAGGNGAGKSTLLSVLGGRKLVPPDAARVLSRAAFHDTSLHEHVLYLGEWWNTESFMDVTVEESMRDLLELPRFERIRQALGVELHWVIARVSDGQRRRCQLLANLAQPKKLYLLDEITSELDILARENILEMIREETELNGATVLYATHVLDDMDSWATHVLFLRCGEVVFFCPVDEFPALRSFREAKSPNPLYRAIRQEILAGCDGAAGRYKVHTKRHPASDSEGTCCYEVQSSCSHSLKRRRSEEQLAVGKTSGHEQEVDSRHRGVKEALMAFVENNKE